MSSETTATPKLQTPVDRLCFRGICLLTMFYSVFFAADGLLMTLQILMDDVPHGTVHSVGSRNKLGPVVHFDTGRTAIIPDYVLGMPPQRLQLHVGDRVEKREGSCVYTINEHAVTDFRWVVHNMLFPTHLRFVLLLYMLSGSAYTIRYGRSPLGNQDPKRPCRRKTLLTNLAMLALIWCAWVAVAFIALRCVMSFLGLILKPLLSR